MTSPYRNGTVYEYRSKKKSKESWLCLETNGKLSWKRKDAYQVKGTVYLDEIIQRISITGYPSMDGPYSGHKKPVILEIPIKGTGSRSMRRLAVNSIEDLDSWLEAFARIIGKWNVWKTCIRSVTGQTNVDERNIQSKLQYDKVISLYRKAWQQFLFRVQSGDADGTYDNNENSPPDGIKVDATQWNGHRRNSSDGARHIVNSTGQNTPPVRMASRCSDAQLETIEEDIHF